MHIAKKVARTTNFEEIFLIIFIIGFINLFLIKLKESMRLDNGKMTTL